MVFDMTASTNSRKLMLINPEFPKDVTTTVIRGQTASATFEAKILEHGRPAEYTYQWFVDGVAVEGATDFSFTKDDLTDSATYSVYCEVSNKKGTVATRVATLDVTQLYTPTLDPNYPQNITIAIHNSITCKVAFTEEGNPAECTYQWYKDGSAISGATKSSYTFTPTDAATIKLYCEVTNSVGIVRSRTATVNVTYLYLFNSGDQCTDITGGWTADSTSKTGSDSGAPTITITDVMQIYRAASSSKKRGSVYPNQNYIDFTKYKTLCAVTTTQSAQGECMMNITTKSGSGYESGVIANLNLANTAAGTWSLDVTSINKSAYFYISTVASDDKSVDCRIKQLYLK